MSRGLLVGISSAAMILGVWPGPAGAGVENVPLSGGQQIVAFPSAYDGTDIVGVWATPPVQAQIVDNRGNLPVVILMHGYTSLFETGARPIDFNEGVTSETDCDFRFDLANAGQLRVKPYYQDMIDFFVDRGVAVFAPDSFSGRCLLDFRSRTPPNDVRAHSFKRAGDAYASLQWLNTTYRYVDSHRVAVVGVSYGGSAAILSVADVARMTRAPFAPVGYADPSYGYEPPPKHESEWRFAAAVSVGGATGYHGYLGSNAITIGNEAVEALGLYGNYAPLLMLCGESDTACHEPDGLTSYGKFGSLLQKAAVTTPLVGVDHEVYANAGSDYVNPANDAEFAGNAAARQGTFRYFEEWLIPRIAGTTPTGNAVQHVPLPAGQQVVSFVSGYDGVELLGVLAVPPGNASIVNGRPTTPVVILMHGSSGLFRDSPLDWNRGDPNDDTPGDCFPVFSPADYSRYRIKNIYQTMVDFLHAHGVIVLLVDSYSGRCLESFQDQVPPKDVYAHPFKRAHDAYEALDWLREASPVRTIIGEIGVAGYSHGGTSTILALADVGRMTTCPFAPPGYTLPKWGYERPPTPTATRRFTAGVNFYGGMGIYGYLGTSSVDRGKEALQATGLYNNYAPLLMTGGDQDDIYYEADDPTDNEWGKFTSFLLKAFYTPLDVELDAYVFPGAGHSILDVTKDVDFPANAGARKRIYGLVETWFLPKLRFLF
jgi:dienelactone hydrolase